MPDVIHKINFNVDRDVASGVTPDGTSDGTSDDSPNVISDFISKISHILLLFFSTNYHVYYLSYCRKIHIFRFENNNQYKLQHLFFARLCGIFRFLF